MEGVTACLFYLTMTLSTFFPTQNAFAAQELETLLSPFRKIQSIQIPYEEKRYSLFLKHPQSYQGIIEYTQPDTFIKEITSPTWKKLIIENNRLVIISKSFDGPDSKSTLNERNVSLDDFLQFKQFKALFTGLLQGDASQLTQYYDYDIIQLPNHSTQLNLQSRAVDVFTEAQQNTSQKIQIIISNKAIKRITTTGFGGERSVLVFSSPTSIIKSK